MFSTGSKLYLGLTTAAVLGTVVYALFQNFGALGGTGLTFLALALAGLSIAVIYTRDADVSAMDSAAIASAPAAANPVNGGLWPFVGALGGLLLVIGSVTDKRYFVAGIVFVVIAVAEWMVQGWAERASADGAFNRTVRARILHPLELPIAGALGLAVIIYGFSRVMLAVPKEAGPALFVVAGAVITIFGTLFASKPNLRTKIIGGICAAGAVLVVAGGLAGAATGERKELAEAAATKHFSADHRECDSAEATEGDKDSSGAVAAKSNAAATFVFDGTKLTAKPIAGTPSDTITIDRGNATSFLFKNEGPEAVRLTVYGGTSTTTVSGVEVKNERRWCTRLVGKDKAAWLTFVFPKSSVSSDPYFAYVPGHDGAKVTVVVP